ncbi:unnamed protein product [Staurois parvus]|uniref:Uncharacterized protein n=1 Tax=Staurois parvus TaxID=386267 RepID=A0ABN9H1E7_9NEOB|nr:unnamed protein product [Staurois parvus]
MSSSEAKAGKCASQVTAEHRSHRRIAKSPQSIAKSLQSIAITAESQSHRRASQVTASRKVSFKTDVCFCNLQITVSCFSIKVN